jgi:hypothetical protein
VKLNLLALRNKAVELIMDLAGDTIPGPEKMDEVLDELADDADDFLKWTWIGAPGLLLEMVDGPALRALIRVAIRPHVEAAYRALVEAGKVEST